MSIKHTRDYVNQLGEPFVTILRLVKDFIADADDTLDDTFQIADEIETIFTNYADKYDEA